MEYYEGGFIQSSPKREFTGTKTIRSLTISQINKIEVEDSSTIYRVDNAEVNNILFIGWVRTCDQMQRETVFTVEDGTGCIKCTFWPNTIIAEEQNGFITEGNLLKLVGSPRLHNNTREVNVVHLSIVEDYNYISYHFINCCYQHFYHCNRIKNENVGNDNIAVGISSDILTDVLECFRSNQDENGLHVDFMIKMLSNKYSEKDLRGAVDTLINDCHLFSVEGQEYKTII